MLSSLLHSVALMPPSLPVAFASVAVTCSFVLPSFVGTAVAVSSLLADRSSIDLRNFP